MKNGSTFTSVLLSKWPEQDVIVKTSHIKKWYADKNCVSDLSHKKVLGDIKQVT